MTDKLCSAAIILGFTLCFIAACLDARADPTPIAKRIDPGQVEQIATKVRAILSLQGFEPKSPLPYPAYSTKLIGYDGLVVEGSIIVNSDAPAECLTAIIAHEYAHIVLGRDYGMQPRESEIFARQIERIVSPDYLPNCESPL